MNDVKDVLPFVFGAGGVAFLTALFKWINEWRDSAEFREGKAIANLERWRNEADARALKALNDAEWEREMGLYWAVVAGTYRFALLSNGIQSPEIPDKPVRKEHDT